MFKFICIIISFTLLVSYAYT